MLGACICFRVLSSIQVYSPGFLTRRTRPQPNDFQQGFWGSITLQFHKGPQWSFSRSVVWAPNLAIVQASELGGGTYGCLLCRSLCEYSYGKPSQERPAASETKMSHSLNFYILLNKPIYSALYTYPPLRSFD